MWYNIYERCIILLKSYIWGVGVDMGATLSPKAQKLVETARDLFFRYGIKRVSIEEICRESGISKMTFYKHFKNKDAITIQIVEELYQDALNKINKILSQNIPFDEKIRQVAIFKVKIAKEYSNEFINDLLQDKDSECGKYLTKKRLEWNELTKKIYTGAQKRGEIRPDIKIEFIMFIFDCFREIILDEKIRDLYPDKSQIINEMFNLLFYGIINRDKKQ